jgi:hypothetical protein
MLPLLMRVYARDLSMRMLPAEQVARLRSLSRGSGS